MTGRADHARDGWWPAVPAPARRLAVALLCVLPFGLVWSAAGAAGTLLFVPTLSVVPDYNDGGTTLETGGYLQYFGSDHPIELVSQAPVRLLLGVAAVAFLLAALRRVADTHRCVVAGIVALLAADALALAARASVVLLVLLAATWLALPARWRSRDALLARSR